MSEASTEIRKTDAGLEYLRTPEACFGNLPGFPYAPNYVEIDGLRMAYVDEGPRDGQTLLLLHGEPAWSFLYRRMIPILVEAGFRCVAPDLIGFGRSDKPVERSAYTYAGHVAWIEALIDALELKDLVLFGQDWGGLTGLRVVARNPERFVRVVIGNTALPVGKSLGPGFDAWLAFSQSDAFTSVSDLFANAIQARTLSDAEVAAYGAPFPTVEYLAGVYAFPTLVPITPEHAGVDENLDAWRVLESWEKPFLTLWCPADAVLGEMGQEFIDRIPGAAGQPHERFEPGGHFIQDDRGEDVARALVNWLA